MDDDSVTGSQHSPLTTNVKSRVDLEVGKKVKMS